MKYEAIIVGGGVTGASLALLLGQAGMRICLLDKGFPSRVHQTDLFKGKTASLNLASIELFKKMGIWERVDQYSKEFTNIEVWDAEGSSAITFNAQDISESKLGKVAHNNNILSSIFDLFHKLSNIDILENESVLSINNGTESIEIKTDSGLDLTANLVVGSDGSMSSIRSLSSIPIRTWSYEQTAIVSLLEPEIPINKTAYQIFTSTGPIALLPVTVGGEDLASLIWSADKVYAEKLLTLEDSEFLEELKLKTEGKLGHFKIREAISSFPLHQLHAKEYFSERTVLVGDSAHTIHPLAGQGLNLGLSDVIDLSERILSLRREGRDIADEQMLKAYSDSREKINLRMAALMEAFKRGFGSKNPWVKLGRNFAFSVANESKFLKKKFIKEAAGIT
ncbi:MAG: FAD-dependent monooxygenase [Gammaproteobacteria bacterium]